MEESLVTIPPEKSTLEAAQKMAASKIGSLLVMDNNKYIGMITETDLTRKIIAGGLNPKETPVAVIMSRPLVSLDCEKTMPNAFVTMRKHNVRHITVTQNKKIIGILSMKDFANYFNSKFADKQPH